MKKLESKKIRMKNKFFHARKKAVRLANRLKVQKTVKKKLLTLHKVLQSQPLGKKVKGWRKNSKSIKLRAEKNVQKRIVLVDYRGGSHRNHPLLGVNHFLPRENFARRFNRKKIQKTRFTGVSPAFAFQLEQNNVSTNKNNNLLFTNAAYQKVRPQNRTLLFFPFIETRNVQRSEFLGIHFPFFFMSKRRRFRPYARGAFSNFINATYRAEARFKRVEEHIRRTSSQLRKTEWSRNKLQNLVRCTKIFHLLNSKAQTIAGATNVYQTKNKMKLIKLYARFFTNPWKGFVSHWPNDFVTQRILQHPFMQRLAHTQKRNNLLIDGLTNTFVKEFDNSIRSPLPIVSVHLFLNNMVVSVVNQNKLVFSLSAGMTLREKSDDRTTRVAQKRLIRAACVALKQRNIINFDLRVVNAKYKLLGFYKSLFYFEDLVIRTIFCEPTVAHNGIRRKKARRM